MPKKKVCKVDDKCYSIPSFDNDLFDKKQKIDQRGCSPFMVNPKTKPAGWTYLDESTNLLYIVTKDHKWLEPPVKYMP